MEYVIIGLVLAAALACPVLMSGPMLLRRFGIIKGGSGGMSCMGMPGHGAPAQPASVDKLIASREWLDREIARLQSADDSPQAGATAMSSSRAPSTHN